MAATNYIMVRMRPDLAERVERQIKRLGISKNAFATMALTKLIEEEEKITPKKK